MNFRKRFKDVLFFLGVLLAVAGIGVWLGTGSHRGWTLTSVEVMKTDEITGIEHPTYEKRFVAGLDFLGSSLVGAAAFLGLSWVIKKKR